MEFSIIYEDKDILAIDKPPGITVFLEDSLTEKTVATYLLENYPWFKDVGRAPRYGIAHRLDKDTSGLLLVAKNNESFVFLQDQFKKRKVKKKYLTLATGSIKERDGVIETFAGRAPKDKRKQKAYLPGSPEAQRGNLRKAVTAWKLIKKLVDRKGNHYSLLDVAPETGRKHQIRSHFAHINHPLAGDKLYGFKNQPLPEGLTRHFLHAYYLKLKLPDGNEKEITSALAPDIKKVLDKLIEEDV
ncbi:MAG: RluA family pseudouridine synthase [bacterium]